MKPGAGFGRWHIVGSTSLSEHMMATVLTMAGIRRLLLYR